MSRPDDWAEMRACVRLTREIFAQEALIAGAGAMFPDAATVFRVEVSFGILGP